MLAESFEGIKPESMKEEPLKRSKVGLSSRIPPPRPPAELPGHLYAALDAAAANWIRRVLVLPLPLHHRIP